MSFVHAADPEITNREIDPETEDLVVDYFELLGENEFSYHQKNHIPMDNIKKNILFYIEKTNYLDYHNLLWLRENMKTDKSISEDGYRDFQLAIKALGEVSVLDQIRQEIAQRPYEIANDSVIQGMKYEGRCS